MAVASARLGEDIRPPMKADQVTVRRGASMGALVEVFGDLYTGDVVAKRGSEELRPGTAVALRASPALATSASGSK